jgi:hypothetical protein
MNPAHLYIGLWSNMGWNDEKSKFECWNDEKLEKLEYWNTERAN